MNFLSRRGLLRGTAGMVGAGAVRPSKVVSQLQALPLDERTGSDDPHTGATYRAVIDVVVPETPGLADELGEEHRTGGIEAGVDDLLPRFIDEFVAPEAGVGGIDLDGARTPGVTTEETVPLSEAVAGALEAAAQALLAQGGNEDDPEPGRFGPAGGAFAALSRRDRRAAMSQLEEGDGAFVVALVTAFPAILYYSEAPGYPDALGPPSELDLDEDELPGWRQTGYPGPADGYAALRGYEVQRFSEDRGPPRDEAAADQDRRDRPGRDDGGADGDAGNGEGAESALGRAQRRLEEGPR